MKAAHLLRKYDPAEWGGTESALLGLCEGLRQEGADSVVFAPRLAAEARPDPLAEAGCTVKRFAAQVPIWGLPAERRRQLVAMGGNLMSFELVRKLWREPGLSVVHSHTVGRIGAIGRMVAHRRGLPFVVTLHGAVYDLPDSLHQAYVADGRGWEWGKICGLVLRTRRLLADADAVIVGNSRAAALIRARHPGQRVVMQPHGVAAGRYREDHRALARSAFPQIQGRQVLLVLGRIDPAKNQLWAIERMPELLVRHPKAMLVLVGAPTDYAYAEQVGRRIDELGLREHVLVVGGLPPGDPRLIGLCQVARAMLQPSIAETFGLIILEAWASGTPVLSTRTAGASDLIEHGTTGLFIDLARPAELHAHLDRLLTDFTSAAQLIAHGRRAVVNYDTQVLADRMKWLYEYLSEQRARAGRRGSSRPAGARCGADLPCPSEEGVIR